jgi:hypothetical protein
MTLSNYQKNVIRTAVPSVVGLLISLVAKSGLNLPPEALVYLSPLCTTAYYSLIRAAEVKWPQLSWLLGALPSKPLDPKSAPLDKVA